MALTLLAPAAHAAEPVLGLKLGAVLAVALDAAGDQDRWKHRNDDDDNTKRRDERRNDNDDRRDSGREDRNDNRINRAYAIASSRGRVLDVGPQGGSIFWARVATDRGRVDLLIDTDSGRIISER